MLGAGIGLGAGLPIGGQLGQSLNIQNTQSSSENTEDPQVKLKKLKEMLDENLITEEQFNQKRVEILSKI